MSRRITIVGAAGALLLAACVDMPGDAGEPCSDNGFCADGLFCNADKICEQGGPVAPACTDGETRPCTTPTAGCTGGVETCVDGVWGACGGPDYVPITDEICDGIDNDCSGTVDDNTAVDDCPAGSEACVLGICHDADRAPCGYWYGRGDSQELAEMCLVPATNYQVGATPAAFHLDQDLLVDRYEVTNQRYLQYVQQLGDPGSALPTCSFVPPQHDDRSWPASAVDSVATALPDHPVVCVDRAQAEAFCAWAGKRLASGDEWEVAARGASAFTYPWGNAQQGGYANCDDTDCSDIYPTNTCTDGPTPTTCDDTAPVTTLADGASPFELHHMAGNASEWVGDDAGADGVIRGGSWGDYWGEMATWWSDQVGRDSALMTIGFRCALERP